jgi:hypothetical protein
MGHPSDFSSEAFNMVLLSLQNIFRDKQGERAVLDSHLLDALVEPLLNFLPDGVGSGLVLISTRIRGFNHPLSQRLP